VLVFVFLELAVKSVALERLVNSWNLMLGVAVEVMLRS